MKDKILKILSKDKEIRVFLAKTTHMTECAKTLHSLSKTATATLGRLLTANALMASDLKGENNTVSLQIRSEGPIGNILTYANSKCEVKGYVSNPDVDLPIRKDGKIDVGGAVGLNGSLTVVKDIGGKEPYTGTIELVSGEIAQDLTYYFAKSEQIPTAIALGVLVDKDNRCVLSSGGLMIQLLPDASEETILRLEEILNSNFSISKLLCEEDYIEKTLKLIFPDEDYEILEEIYPVLRCDCSKERFLRGIISLGKAELEKLINEEEKIVANCHFCNTSYEYLSEELKPFIK
ncbi:MAG: Hsp33 family molecular chaperone HslO [Ruminococcaceae bacterium]|nr:Hsp33 family molecular chaperone HslO [Oscillospiraceae bacterium]